MTPRRVRILMASTVHRWNDARIYYKEARSLTKIADVRLVAVQTPDAHKVPDDGRIVVDLLPVNGLRPGDRKSVLPRLKRIGMVMKTVLQQKYDVFHFHDLELIPVGWLAKMQGKKVIYDVHEDSRSAMELREWLSRPVAKVMAVVGRALERLSLCVFDRFILAETAYRDFFPSQTCQVVQNYLHTGIHYRPQSRKDHQPLKLVYAGQLTAARGSLDMLAAVKRLRCEGVNVTLDLFGTTISPQIQGLIQEGESQCWLVYHGYVPYPELLEKLREYHVGLSPLRDHGNYRHSLPTKLLDYMAAGLAIVASDLPRTVEISRETGCAILYKSDDQVELQQSIRAMLDEPTRLRLAQMGSKAVVRYSWASQEQVLLQIYAGMLG